MGTLRNVVIAIVLVAVIGIGVNAFAHSEWGSGCGARGYFGAGMRCQGESGFGGENHQLSKEEYKQVEEKRESFLEETRELRASLFEKKSELQGELAKTEVDTAKASQLQQEISDLQARFDQKHIGHMIEMKKLNPNAGHGFMPGHQMMGGRSMKGHGMGPGVGRGGCRLW